MSVTAFIVDVETLVNPKVILAQATILFRLFIYDVISAEAIRVPFKIY